ncbi:MAG: hypothetical protein HUJ26_14525 [Planctomycetaceae bacterium]|nr:hypothetical protein [Planctomycetaceae bacterium]
MKLSLKITCVAVMVAALSITSVSEAGKSFGKINGGSQFKSRTVRRPSTANLHHNFNYKQRGGSSSSRNSRSFSNFKKPALQQKSSSHSSRLQNMSNNSRLKSIGNNSRLKTITNNSRTRDLNNLKKIDNLRQPVVKSPAKGKGLFDGKKPGQDGWKTIMPVDPELGVHKPNPGYGNDIVFPKPRPHAPIFCPPGRRPIVCLPPITICPPVHTPCVVNTCQNVVVEEQVVVEEEKLEPVLQLVVGQPAALEAEGLGEQAGQVVFEVNGLGLPAKITMWEDRQLGIEVPLIGLQAPTTAFMHLIDADGQPLASIPVELLMEIPAETK